MGLAEHRRLDELAVALWCAPAEQTGTLGQGIVDVPGDLAHCRGIDQRTDGDSGLHSIADPEFAHLLHQARSEALVNAILHQDSIGADAGLAGVAELALHDPGNRLFEVRIVEHDEGRIATQLETEALDLIGTLAHQQAAHSSRTGEGNLAHGRVAGQLLADARRHAGNHVEHPGRDADPLGQHRQRQRRQRSQIGGLDHNRAAGRQGWRALAGDHRIGEVPRRDGRTHTNRLFQGKQATITTRCGNGFAIHPASLLGEPFDETGAVSNLALGFSERLALLAGHDQCQIVEIVKHGLIPAFEQCGTLRGGPGSPGRPGTFGRFDGTASFAALQSRNPGETLAVGRVDDIESGAIVGAHPLAIDIGTFHQQAGIFQTILQHGRVLFRDRLQSIEPRQTRMLKAPPER
ncbi:hypothetical protein D9M68_522750 [compost metagenome]